jgi:hypothetical protein
VATFGRRALLRHCQVHKRQHVEDPSARVDEEAGRSHLTHPLRLPRKYHGESRAPEEREGPQMGVAPPSARVSKPTGFERTVTLQIR